MFVLPVCLKYLANLQQSVTVLVLLPQGHIRQKLKKVKVNCLHSESNMYYGHQQFSNFVREQISVSLTHLKHILIADILKIMKKRFKNSLM